jgi:sialidase-1
MHNSQPIILNVTNFCYAGEGLMYGYRIPVITHAPDGSLVAVSEGRKDSTNDFGTKLLSIRRSSDGGLTWSTTGTFEDDGDNYSSSLGVILTDYVENITMVIYTLNHYDRSSCSIIMIKSYDNGLTWEDPENITKQIGQLPFYGGPGYGIQKKHDPMKGRLLACGHGLLPGDGIVCIYSDNHGVTWHIGTNLSSIPYGQTKKWGDFCPDENQLVELENGSLLFSIRNEYSYHAQARMFAKSYDGEWPINLQEVWIREDLPDPVCAAGMLYLEEYGILVHSNPFSKTQRINMTISWSYDHGETWNDGDRLQIWPGPSGYSCLTAVPTKPGYIGLLYEKGSNYESYYFSFISYVSINLNLKG